MQMINKVEVLRAMLFTVEDFNTILNKQDFPQFNEADLDFMIEFKKIYELGEPQLRRFITKLDAEGTKLDPYSINYYTSVLKAGPFGNMVRDILGDLNQHQYWKPLPDGIGRNADNSHTAANTAWYPDSPQQDGVDRRLHPKLPNFMIGTLGKGLSSTNSVFYSSLASSTVVDNTYVKKDPQITYEKAQDGTLQDTAHGGYGVNDLKFLRTIQTIFPSIQNNVNNSFNSEDQRMLEEQDVGYLANEFTTVLLPDPQQSNIPVGQDFFPNSNNIDNISKNFKIQKRVVDNNKERMIELDLYGNEFDSDIRRERLLKIGGKEFDKNLNLNIDEGQLGNVGDPNSTELVQTTMAPFNSGGTPAGVAPPVPIGTGAITPQPFAPTNPPIPLTDDGSINIAARNSYLKGLPEGKRNLNGLITVSSYGQADDSTPDSNTVARRGFKDNLLRVGTVALSPDIYNHFKPAIGTLVLIDGISIGYYEDRTPASHNGQPYGICIDVYDPGGTLGPILKNAGPAFKLTFGARRQQISNPSGGRGPLTPINPPSPELPPDNGPVPIILLPGETAPPTNVQPPFDQVPPSEESSNENGMVLPPKI